MAASVECGGGIRGGGECLSSMARGLRRKEFSVVGGYLRKKKDGF